MTKLLSIGLFGVGVIPGLFLGGCQNSSGQAAVPGVTIVLHDYWDCDPLQSASCAPKMKYVEYRSSTGEWASTTTELSKPGQPSQIQIRGRGKLLTAFPEVNGHFTLRTEQWTPQAAGKRVETSASNHCFAPGTRLAGESTLLGHKVLRYESESASGARVDWLAPDLNCVALRQEFRWKAAAPGSTQITYKVASEVRVEIGPDSVWEAPAGSREMSPSELYRTVWVNRWKIRDGLTTEAAEARWLERRSQFELQTAKAEQTWQTQHSR